MDRKKIQEATALLIEGLGEHAGREGLMLTPYRVANMWEEILTTSQKPITAFSEKYSEMVLVKDIPFFSFCEHHILPFYGKAHIGYIPNGKVLGLSKLVRILDKFAHGLQIQERLTSQVAEYIDKELRPEGVGVILEATHLCMVIRGVKRSGSVTITSGMRGCFLKGTAREEFLKLIK